MALFACSLGGASSLLPIQNLAIIRLALVLVGRILSADIFSVIAFCRRDDFIGVGDRRFGLGVSVEVSSG